MSELVAQVRITNTATSKGVVFPKVLSIKASRLKDYIQQLKSEADGVYTPNRSKEFEYLPLLSLWDLADTGEEVLYKTEADLPKSTVFNSKGIPILIIIPEVSPDDIGLNQFQHLSEKELKKVNVHLAKIPRSASKMKPSNS